MANPLSQYRLGFLSIGNRPWTNLRTEHMTIEMRITEIASENNSHVSMLNGQVTAARASTIALLALVYDLGMNIINEVPGYSDADFIKAMNDRGIIGPQKGENPWGKIIPMSCGDWKRDEKGEAVVNEDGKRTWRKNASLDKYARALRLMEERAVPSSEARTFMANFHEGDRRLLDGMIAVDKDNHPAAVRGLGPKAQMALNKAVSKLSLGRVALDPSDCPDDGEVRTFSRAFGYFENAEFVLMGFVSDSQKAAQLDAAKAGGELE